MGSRALGSVALGLAVPLVLAGGVAAAVWASHPAKDVVPVGAVSVPGSRACILMFSTPNIVDEYAGYAARANLAYARRHGYAFEHVVGPSSESSPAWDKVRLLRQALDRHEAVVWIDSDAAFNGQDRSLEWLLSSREDIVGCSDHPNGPYKINCGVLVLRSTPWTKRFLDLWWSMRLLPKYQRWAFEQEAMHDLVVRDALRCVSFGKLRIEPYHVFNSAHQDIQAGRRDTFVLHFMACPADMRRRELQAVCRAWDA